MTYAKKIKHGTLTLVVGPSGVGKDTLLDAAKAHFINDPAYHFPKRVITRQSQTGEDHIPVNEESFANMRRDDRFLIDWRAHGLAYGIPVGVRSQLENGVCVVVNSSRQVIDLARERWPLVRVVHIVTDPNVLRQRLLQRGRETAEDVEQRVLRATQIKMAPDETRITIDNSKTLQDAIASFIDGLKSVSADDNAQAV